MVTQQLIDLHTHSTASDGTDSPADLVAKAAEKGLCALALTDHDTVSGIKEARTAARDYNMEFIAGCEISATTSEGNIHILGLWLPDDYSVLDNFLRQLKSYRAIRNQQMIEKLQRAGLKITLEEIAIKANGMIGRPHIAKVLAEKGYARTYEDAFTKWIGKGGKAYIPKPALTPCEVVDILAKTGCSAIFAHPLLKPRSGGWLENTIREMKACGLFGLEAWHTHHSPEATAVIHKLAEKYDLALSGGSDYHGTNKPDIELGRGKNNLCLTWEILEKLKARRKALGLPV